MFKRVSVTFCVIGQQRMASNVASTTCKIAVCQMRATIDKVNNYEICKTLIETAKKKNARMVFLPECFDYVGTSPEETSSLAERIDGPTIASYKKLSQELNIWLSLGGFHEKVENESRILNSHIILDPNGEIRGHYHKTHLFDVKLGNVELKETDITIPGEVMQLPVHTPVGKVGMGICYDVRFPRMSSWLADKGAEILTFPSAFTVPTGQAHWHPLLRARAIENQCYVVAAAQIGEHHAKRTSYGHALVVDPWGKIIAECSEDNEVQCADVNLDYLYQIRDKMPVKLHARDDIYHVNSTQFQDSYQFGHVTVEGDCVFYSTSLSFAFVNIKPVLPGHILISPIQPLEKFADLSHEQTADLFTTAQKVVKVLQRIYDTDSVTVAIQDGPEAGQTIKHVHIHVLPRKRGDFNENDDIYDKLEHHDTDMTAGKSRMRSREDRAREAAMMRQHFC